MAVVLAFMTLAIAICTISTNIQASENSDSAKVERNILSGISLDFIKHGLSMVTSKNGLIHIIETFIVDELWKLTSNLTLNCRQDIKYVLNEAITNRKMNGSILDSLSLKLLDSFGKPEAGIMSGNRFWLGNFDQCIDIEVLQQGSSEVRFLGEYCLAHISPVVQLIQSMPMNISLYLGTCFPSSCTFEDKQKIMEIMITPLKRQNIVTSVGIAQQSCTTKRPTNIDVITQFSIAILCIPMLLVCAATIADYIWNYWNDATVSSYARGLFAELLLSFSAIRSLKTIFQRKEINSNLSAMHGIRVVSMIWVIIGHFALLCVSDYPWHNQLDARKIFKKFLFQPFGSDAMLSVTTFFSLSGFLVTYLFMQQIHQHKRWLIFVGFYMYRYIRLTPAYIVVIVVLIGPFVLIGQGPLWKLATSNLVANCRQGWWKNLLYINSWNGIFTECYPISWYLSTDTMLYFIAPVFLHPLFMKPMVAFVLFGLFSFAATVTTLVLIITHGYHTYFGADLSSFSGYIKFSNELYIKPWYNFTSYAISMIAGYLLFICEERNIKLTKKITVSGWFLSLLIMSLILFGKFPYFSGEKEMSQLVNAIHGTFSRPAWAMCVSWIIFACATGNGGLVNRLLSIDIFVPMSRLTYSAYLVHFMVLLYYFSLQSHSLHFSIYNLAMLVCGNVAVTMVAALVLAVLAEIPIIEFMKQLGKWYYSSTPSTKAITGPKLKDGEILRHADVGTLSLLLQKDRHLSESSDCEYCASGNFK